MLNFIAQQANNFVAVIVDALANVGPYSGANSELFSKFPLEAVLWGFIFFKFPSWKLPISREVLSRPSTRRQNLTTFSYYCGGYINYRFSHRVGLEFAIALLVAELFFRYWPY